MSTELIKFSSQADKKLLAEVKNIAKTEGKQLQSILNEALSDFINKYNNSNYRDNVMAISRKNRIKFNDVFKKLAK